MRNAIHAIYSMAPFVNAIVTQPVASWDPYDQNASSPFFDSEWMFGITDGFDVVIGNPPYVSAWQMEKENPKARPEIKNALKEYSIIVGHWDLYIAFVAKGHEVLKNSANLHYIVPNPILREKYATKTRRFLLESMKLKRLLEFNEINVFENVARRTTVLLATKNICSYNYPISIFGYRNEENIELLNTVNKESWLAQPRSVFLIKGNKEQYLLLKRIENQSDKIGNYFYVNYGAQVSSKRKGAFGKREVVGKTPKGNAKEFYEGKDVQRWRLNYRGLYLDYRINELYGPRSPELFEQNKIVIRKVSDKNHSLSATFDDSKRHTDDGNVLLVPYSSLIGTELRAEFKDFTISKENIDLKYALAVILSKLEGFYFRNTFATESLQGSTSHTYPTSVRGLLVKKVSETEQKPFIEIVDKILKIAKDEDYLQNPQKKAKVKAFEAEINQLVYKLYDLTSEEIKIVEGRK